MPRLAIPLEGNNSFSVTGGERERWQLRETRAEGQKEKEDRGEGREVE